MTVSSDRIERLRQEIQALISLREAKGDIKPGHIWIRAGDASSDIVVCVRSFEAVDENFGVAIWELLLDLPREISVTLLDADPDTGEPLQPPHGIRTTSDGPVSVPEPPPIDEATRELSDRLQHEVGRILAAHGHEDAFGNGDYWIVDWIHPSSCKVCVWRIRFLTPSLVEEVQGVLRRRFRDSEVIFALDLVDAPNLPPGGIIVTAKHVQQDWDKPRLRELFGSDFKWA